MKFEHIKNFFVDIDDGYFIKAQKITINELTHAFYIALKEKELEIENARVRRKISKT